jgi:predicted MFS family arabinose efflux permease
MFERLARLIWGTDFDPELRPLLFVAFSGTFAGTAAFPFLGIWALEHLGASEVQLSVGLLLGAVTAIGSGWLGGHLSDHVGRRRVMLAAWTATAVVPLGLIAVRHHVIVGLAVMASFGVCGSMFNAAEYAMVGDLLPPERRETGYASVRVAQNLGVCFGPALGGLLLLGNDWTRLFLGVFAFSVVAVAFAVRLLPRRGRYAPEGPPARNSFPIVFRDRPFLFFVGAMVLASMTYVAFDTLLPISLATSHGISPATWGFLVIINAALVTFGQLRLTRATARVSASVKLAIAMPLMGLPFLFLSVVDSVGAVAAMMVVFVVGEMLWVPTSQAVVAAFAPADIRGAYMGVFGSTSSVAFALTPFAGLQLRHAYGDEAMWAGLACISLVAAVGGALAARNARRSVVPVRAERQAEVMPGAE